jgi:hypothetical protein
VKSCADATVAHSPVSMIISARAQRIDNRLGVAIMKGYTRKVGRNRPSKEFSGPGQARNCARLHCVCKKKALPMTSTRNGAHSAAASVLQESELDIDWAGMRAVSCSYPRETGAVSCSCPKRYLTVPALGNYDRSTDR